MLRRSGRVVHVGGNIGTPLLCKADDMGADDIAVVELSSFQLMTMSKSPHIAVITNIAPNHLDVHSDMDEYIKAKRNIYTHQGPGDRVVLNYDNAYTHAFADLVCSEVLFFSRHGRVDNGIYLEDGVIYEAMEGDNRAVMRLTDIFLPGLHNAENYMAACAAVKGLATFDAMRETARTFRGVPHRIEFIREVHGVKFYNDSIASSPSRTIAGLQAFDQKIILIAGGKDKGVAFDELAEEIIAHVKTLVLTGLTAQAINKAVLEAPGYIGTPEIIIRDDFEQAVVTAALSASEGDVVLLSPACTSFDRFRNFEERGEFFSEIVKGMSAEQWI
jgi:UDP-N-acetylmuramoylalanine--D-glutamate ligase